MRKDRSWVLPLAIVTLVGIVLAAGFAILRAEDLFLSEKGAYAATWLTLVVTALGFGVTIYIVGMTARQIRDSRKNVDLQDFRSFTERNDLIGDVLDVITEIRPIIWKYTRFMRSRDGVGYIDKNDLIVFRSQYRSLMKYYNMDYFNDLQTDGGGITAYLMEFILLEGCLSCPPPKEDRQAIKEHYETIIRPRIESFEEIQEIYRTKLTDKRKFIRNISSDIVKKHY